MERFTDWIDDAKTEVSIVNYKMQAAMLRLAAYEDTGLTPEEIMDSQLLTGWIPVTERLPETSGIMLEDEKILIILADGTRTISFYINTAQGGKIFFDGWDTYHPIAWMPLPEPYKPPVMQETEERAGEYADAPTLLPAT